MEISSDEWINIGTQVCNAYRRNEYMHAITNKQYGKTHCVSKTITYIDRKFITLKSKMDSIICEYYPRDINSIPGTDKLIVSTFYGIKSNEPDNDYKSMGKTPDEIISFILQQTDKIILHLNEVELFLTEKHDILNAKLYIFRIWRKEIIKCIDKIKKKLESVRSNFLIN